MSPFLFFLETTPSLTNTLPSAAESVFVPYLKPLTVHSVRFNPAAIINQIHNFPFPCPWQKPPITSDNVYVYVCVVLSLCVNKGST